MSKPEFVGTQIPADNCVHFMTRVPAPFGMDLRIHRVPITEKNSFNSIEDILCDVKLIPLEEQKYSENEICQQVGKDNLTQYGTYFEEFGIICTPSKNSSDNPIVEVIKDGKTIYIPHPDIWKRVRRFVRQENT